jgi:ribosomal protein L37E
VTKHSSYLTGPTTPQCQECGYHHSPEETHYCFSCGDPVSNPPDENKAGGRVWCSPDADRHRMDGHELDESGRWVP